MQVKALHIVSVLAVSFSMLLAGCNSATIMRKITAPQDERTARNYVNLLRQNKIEQIESALDPSIVYPDTEDVLTQSAAMFPPQEPLSSKVVGINVFRGEDFSTTAITLEYEFPGKWLLASVAIKKTSDATSITDISVIPIPDSLENQNRFTLVGKGASQYAAFALAVFALAISLYAFVLCIQTRIGKWKWLWLVLTFVGMTTLSVNWTTGEASSRLFSFYLPPVGVNSTFYSPWFIHISVPLGAMLFLGLRNNLAKSSPHAIEPIIRPSSPPSSHPTSRQSISG